MYHDLRDDVENPYRKLQRPTRGLVLKRVGHFLSKRKHFVGVVEGDPTCFRQLNAPADTIDELTKNDVDVNAFKQTGTATIDGQACTVFSGDQTATLKAFGATGAGAITGAGAEALEQIKNAQMSFAVCEDGLPHRMQLMLEATDKDNPDQTFTFNIDMHMYDFNTPISITAPADAEPLTIPTRSPRRTNPTTNTRGRRSAVPCVG